MIGDNRISTVSVIVIFGFLLPYALCVGNETCTCHESTGGGSCNFFSLANGTITAIYGCDCPSLELQKEINNNTGTFIVKCSPDGDYPSATTPVYYDYYDEDENDEISYGYCNNTALTDGKKGAAKALFYIGSICVILWTIFTFIINIVLKEKGHHRYIGCFEEITIIVLFIFLGFLTWNSGNKGFCRATIIILHFTLLLLQSFWLMEAIFANSLIKGRSKLNGMLPPVLNYLLPFLIAFIPTIISFFTLKKYYGATGIHCFVVVYTDMLWAWSIPTWILLITTIVIGQLAFLACKQEDKEVDKQQLFWAKKCCKSLPLLLILFLSTYYLAIFALDFQRLFLAVLFFILCLLLGPTIFICHTFSYQNTATKIWTKTSLGVYRPCKGDNEKKDDTVNEDEKEDEKNDEKPKEDRPENPTSEECPKNEPLPGQVPPEEPKPPPPAPPPQPADNFEPKNPANTKFLPTSSQEFYDWLTNRDVRDIHHTENILFKPHPH